MCTKQIVGFILFLFCTDFQFDGKGFSFLHKVSIYIKGAKVEKKGQSHLSGFENFFTSYYAVITVDCSGDKNK